VRKCTVPSAPEQRRGASVFVRDVISWRDLLFISAITFIIVTPVLYKNTA
jgi:hypothetical protein